MRVLKYLFPVILAAQLSCGSGGPLTPAESFNAIKIAVEKKDSEAIGNYISQSSLDKISKLNQMIKGMRGDQLKALTSKYGYTPEKLVNLKVPDFIALYFFSDATGVNLNRYFKENVVSIDIQGEHASVKTESGIVLDFLREGPYWKFDLTGL